MTPTVVCLTPVWNEAWILDRFLRAASAWADRIIVADQESDDGSRDIVAQYPNAILVENRSRQYDEGARQRLLVDEARKLDGPRVLVALDADEMLTAGGWKSGEWRAAITAPPGTVIRMPWINVLPGRTRAWVPADPIAFGVVDDGRAHDGPRIHSTRVPSAPSAPSVTLGNVGVLHLQYLDTARMRAKQRWYQCFERVEHPRKRPAEIYRQYHHMDAWPSTQIHPVDPASIEGLELAGIEAVTGGADAWHRRILDLMREHGNERFRRVDIWDVDWASEAARLGVPLAPTAPRGFDRAVLRWLRFAQPRRKSAYVRVVSRALQGVGW